MQALRNASLFARLVLAWFALAIGVAVASPLVNPTGIELVCSGAGGIKLLATGDEGSPGASHTLDCPMCASFDAPPPVARAGADFSPALGHAVRSIPAARIVVLAAAHPPARGPPPFVID